MAWRTLSDDTKTPGGSHRRVFRVQALSARDQGVVCWVFEIVTVVVAGAATGVIPVELLCSLVVVRVVVVGWEQATEAAAASTSAAAGSNQRGALLSRVSIRAVMTFLLNEAAGARQ
jgi:hypothetical protein